MSTTTPVLAQPAGIARIVALDDPVRRNLLITQCYHELATAFAARLGGHANWCAFATWASKQAGQTIRREDLRRHVARMVDDALGAHGLGHQVVAYARAAGSRLGSEALHATLRQALEPAVARAADAVARGNLKVFTEIAPVFARFTAERLHDTVRDDAALTAFCETLRPGEPPAGQAYLRAAFRHYHAALFTSDARARAELVFLGNLEVGFHEQTRLQPEIAESLALAQVDAGVLTERLLAVLLPGAGWLTRMRAALRRMLRGPTPLERAVAALVAELQEGMRRLLTEHGLTLALPGDERLRLGHDLPAPFPPSLQHATSPELTALLQRIDPTPDSRTASGALDWASLPERVHFICDFFRCHHERADLFTPPFSAAQTRALAAGGLPQGEL